MNRYLFILFVVLTVFTYSCKDKYGSDLQVITAEEMQSLSEINNVRLVDFDSPKKQKEDSIENIQNIDYLSPKFDEEVLKLDKSKPVLVYCISDNQRTKCVEKMKNAGFVKIYDLDSTSAKWKFKGPVIKSTS